MSCDHFENLDLSSLNVDLDLSEMGAEGVVGIALGQSQPFSVKDCFPPQALGEFLEFERFIRIAF